MNSSPLFSILVANYNNGNCIMNALDSAFSQSYANYEIIIVDDGSTDNSKDILEQFQNSPNVHIFYNDTNRGCGFTKWQCIEKANGELCGFLDADDALTNDALEAMVNAHLSHPDASLVYSRYFVCDKMLNVKCVSTHQCPIPDDSSFLEFKRGAISHFVSFKKKSYLRTDGMNKQLRMSEDLDLYFKLEEVGKTLFIDKPLYYYRTGTGNNTSLNENVITAAYWEIIAKTDACRRRNLNAEKVELPAIEEIVESVASVKTNQIKQTQEYKLGNYILHPSLLIKKLTKR